MPWPACPAPRSMTLSPASWPEAAGARPMSRGRWRIAPRPSSSSTRWWRCWRTAGWVGCWLSRRWLAGPRSRHERSGPPWSSTCGGPAPPAPGDGWSRRSASSRRRARPTTRSGSSPASRSTRMSSTRRGWPRSPPSGIGPGRPNELSSRSWPRTARWPTSPALPCSTIDSRTAPAAGPAGGIHVAQVHLGGQLDRALAHAGQGSTGGIATLLVQLGDALVADGRVEAVTTIGRGTARDAAASLGLSMDPHAVLAAPLGPPRGRGVLG